MSPRNSPSPTRIPEGAHAGQALVEYLLVLGVIALVCLPAFAFLQGGLARAFGAQSTALSAPNLDTTTAAPALTYTYPASDEACKNGLWRTYVTPAGTFKNQGDCQSWVVTNPGHPRHAHHRAALCGPDRDRDPRRGLRPARG